MEPNRRSLLIEGRVHRKAPCQRRILIRGNIFAVSLLLLGFLATHAAAAAGKPFHYDPSTCTSDAHGKFYVALGTTIVALPPPSGSFMMDDAGLAKRTPPNPKDQVGCPGNPLQTKMYEFLSPYRTNGAHTSNAASSTQTGISQLTLYDLRFGGLNPKAATTPWSAETGMRDRVDQWCKEATRRDELSNGLIACRFQQTPDEVRVEDWAVSYMAKSPRYMTPLGHTFVIECGGFLYSHGIANCRVEYAVTQLLGMSYTFEPYRGRVVLPIDQIIDFDRGLRGAIRSAIVPHYDWPAPTPASNLGGKP